VIEFSVGSLNFDASGLQRQAQLTPREWKGTPALSQPVQTKPSQLSRWLFSCRDRIILPDSLLLSRRRFLNQRGRGPPICFSVFSSGNAEALAG
jgi:hypothetical protein